MISGTFGENDELLFELQLIANNGLELPVEAWLDTGFSGWLAMNAQDLEALDWIYVGQQKMETAREEVNFELYAGKVRLDGQVFDISRPCWFWITGIFNRPSVVKKSEASGGYAIALADSGRRDFVVRAGREA